MAVGLKVGPIFYQIGTGSFLHCFFSNIAHYLEEGNWGSKYPILMNHLYKGSIENKDLEQFKIELNHIREAFKEYHPNMAIWEIENLDSKPPWGNTIADRITSLSNYFYTSDGRDLFDVFILASDAATQVNKNLEIKTL